MSSIIHQRKRRKDEKNIRHQENISVTNMNIVKLIAKPGQKRETMVIKYYNKFN